MINVSNDLKVSKPYELLVLTDGLPNGVVEKSSVECLLEKQMLRRFVLVFQILNLDGEERPLTLRTIRVRKPAPEDWITYRQVALSKPVQ